MTPTSGPKQSRQTRILRSLPFRVVVFLAMALLPIGLLAIWQTRDLSEEAAQRGRLNVLALTELAASDERKEFERAFGAAEALGSVLELVVDDPERCREVMRHFNDQAEMFSYVGYVPRDLVSTCSSLEGRFDASDRPEIVALLADPRPAVIRLDDAPASQVPVISVFNPVTIDGAFAGFIALSIPQANLALQGFDLAVQDAGRVLTFNHEGAVLTVGPDEDPEPSYLPQGNLTDHIREMRYTFEAKGSDGETYLYAMQPLLPDTAYVLSAWPPGTLFGPSVSSIVSSSVFPLLMWFASLLVAYFAVHRLVVGQVRGLSQKMRFFAATRSLPDTSKAGATSLEFEELQETFVKMSYDLIEDEAKMEDALREKNVLLKEVHHRVKNNLQMISSIMNMQIRQSTNVKTKAILRRLQDRILGLATVHRYLYQADDLGKTDAGALLQEITESQFKSLRHADDLDVATHFEPIIMFPDQALPLALLVGEMTTNALKYVSAPPEGPARIAISMARQDSGHVRLTCENTMSDTKTPELEQIAGTGLGRDLIKAFALQLGASPQIDEEQHLYRVTVVFAVTEFKPEPLDY